MFKALDVAALERALGHWVRGGQSAGHGALDGKRLRGSATAQAAGVHLLAAFSASLQGVIGQLAGIYREFCVWGGTMLLKEPSHAAPQTACHPG
jgi:hypothetical protein